MGFSFPRMNKEIVVDAPIVDVIQKASPLNIRNSLYIPIILSTFEIEIKR